MNEESSNNYYSIPRDNNLIMHDSNHQKFVILQTQNFQVANKLLAAQKNQIPSSSAEKVVFVSIPASVCPPDEKLTLSYTNNSPNNPVNLTRKKPPTNNTMTGIAKDFQRVSVAQDFQNKVSDKQLKMIENLEENKLYNVETNVIKKVEQKVHEIDYSDFSAEKLDALTYSPLKNLENNMSSTLRHRHSNNQPLAKDSNFLESPNTSPKNKKVNLNSNSSSIKNNATDNNCENDKLKESFENKLLDLKLNPESFKEFKELDQKYSQSN